MEKPILSWYGYVTGTKGSLLLGGVNHHESSRFATREAASAWVSTVVETNCGAHRGVGAWGETASTLPPEID